MHYNHYSRTMGLVDKKRELSFLRKKNISLILLPILKHLSCGLLNIIKFFASFVWTSWFFFFGSRWEYLCHYYYDLNVCHISFTTKRNIPSKKGQKILKINNKNRKSFLCYVNFFLNLRLFRECRRVRSLQRRSIDKTNELNEFFSKLKVLISDVWKTKESFPLMWKLGLGKMIMEKIILVRSAK